MTRRLLVLSVCLALTAGYLARPGRAGESHTSRATLAAFPAQIGEWTGRPAPSLDKAVVDALGVDEYVNRYYTAGNRVVHLYIGYYGSQREGRTIHSPMNCLPGSGWTPLASAPLTLVADTSGAQARRMVVNDTVIQKGLERQVVLYWYQSHGRVESNEVLEPALSGAGFDSAEPHRRDAHSGDRAVPGTLGRSTLGSRADGDRLRQRDRAGARSASADVISSYRRA